MPGRDQSPAIGGLGQGTFVVAKNRKRAGILRREITAAELTHKTIGGGIRRFEFDKELTRPPT